MLRVTQAGGGFRTWRKRLLAFLVWRKRKQAVRHAARGASAELRRSHMGKAKAHAKANGELQDGEQTDSEETDGDSEPRPCGSLGAGYHR